MRDPIDDMRVATPCEASWDAMAGDERVRHCSLCDLNVYNFAELTREEIRALLLRSEGRVCGRLYRRADGTLLTRDCPTGLAALRQRMSRFANATLGALLSVWAFATGCATAGGRKSGMELRVEPATTSQSVLFAGVVRTDDGIPLPGVTVVLRDEQTSREMRAVTDANGTFSIAAGQEGTYRIEVTLAGLMPAVRSHVHLKGNEISRAGVIMRLAPRETITIGALVDPYPREATISTTFSQDLINKLP